MCVATYIIMYFAMRKNSDERQTHYVLLFFLAILLNNAMYIDNLTFISVM